MSCFAAGRALPTCSPLSQEKKITFPVRNVLSVSALNMFIFHFKLGKDQVKTHLETPTLGN